MSDTHPPISVRQRRILDFISEHFTEHGYPPTLREVGAAVGLGSSSSVAHQLGVLQARGFITRDPNTPRAISITETGPERGAAAEVRRAALAHAIEQYAGPDDGTLPVLRRWLEELGGNPDSEQP